jgi:glycosyltransferase involved in cell wall biosynthesis
MPRGLNPVRMVISTFHMAAYLRRERIDLVHTHCSMPGVLGRIAARLAGVPVIMHTIHGYHVHDRWNPAMRMIYTWAEKLCGSFTDMLLSQNRNDLELTRRARIVPSGRLKFIGNGIDVDRFSPLPRVPDADGALRIICTARLEPVKNHPQLFQAVKMLVDRGIAVRVRLIGDGDLRPEYEKLCRELGILDRIEFLGYRDDVPALLAQSDVSVLTSVKEGIPRALLEAMAMEVPVVGTRVVGTEETVRDGETGYLVEYGDAPALADRLAKLAADPALRERLGRRGREVVLAEFDEDQIVEALAQIYYKLLRAKGLVATTARPEPVQS